MGNNRGEGEKGKIINHVLTCTVQVYFKGAGTLNQSKRKRRRG